MASSVKFYFDLVSPVSRPFVILFNYAKISCEMVEVKLRKGEHSSETFVNRFRKVPAINDNGFVLSESVAIFHYLGRQRVIPERWYPTDLKSLARIDEYLEWNHNNLHIGAGMLFYMIQVTPLLTGEQPTAEALLSQKRTLNRCLDDLENLWLRDNKFLTGNEISFADIVAASAVEQVIGMNLFKFEENRHNKVKKWLNDVKEFFGPHFKEAHKIVYKYGASNIEKQ